jgi:hypothetical protein
MWAAAMLFRVGGDTGWDQTLQAPHNAAGPEKDPCPPKRQQGI